MFKYIQVNRKQGEKSETNLGMTVVKELRSLLPSGSYVYFDNYFSSITLVEYLLTRNIYCCATFRKDRIGLPEILKHLRESKDKYS